LPYFTFRFFAVDLYAWLTSCTPTPRELFHGTGQKHHACLLTLGVPATAALASCFYQLVRPPIAVTIIAAIAIIGSRQLFAVPLRQRYRVRRVPDLRRSYPTGTSEKHSSYSPARPTVNAADKKFQ
jgi:hypothetical protein